MIFSYYCEKGEIVLQFIKISFIILLSIYLVALLTMCYKNGKMIKTLLLSAASGLGAMTAVNIFSYFTGVSIAVNLYTTITSALLGIPGVFGLLSIRMFF